FLTSSAAQETCDYLSQVLGTNPLVLTELDLSEDKLGDLDGEKLSALLMDSHSKHEKMKLNNCELTEKSCSVLATVLSSKTILKEMNLNNSRLLDSGVKEICKGLKKSKLKILNFQVFGGVSVTNTSHLRELNISVNQLGDSGVENLGVLLGSSRCKLEKLHLCGCSITEKQCLILTSALCLNPSHLRELDLSQNKIENTGVNHLSDVLKDSYCKLDRLSLNDCGITDVACLAQSLAETKALVFLKELDLSNNKIGDSKQQLSDVLRDSNCKLR
ncbi:ribonuclease inhibitor-like, partial [Sinocyclocheilus rhinocerous]|uniref:ribonuclease inhibitor-like n=1 Tax=Sinocyclocheilus rhinocerous TaxID=307959 RepID=UPI0007BAC798